MVWILPLPYIHCDFSLTDHQTVIIIELGANLAGQEGRRSGGGGGVGAEVATPSALSTATSTREHAAHQFRQENHK